MAAIGLLLFLPGLLEAEWTNVASAWIPSASQIHGQSTLRTDGVQVGVRTILHTPSLRRAVREMLRKETVSWPENRAGYADSILFRESLQTASEEIIRRTEATGPDTAITNESRRFTLIIEMISTPEECRYEIGTADASRTDEGFGTSNALVVSMSQVTPDYANRSILLMARTALSIPDPDLLALLSNTGWAVPESEKEVSESVPLR